MQCLASIFALYLSSVEHYHVPFLKGLIVFCLLFSFFGIISTDSLTFDEKFPRMVFIQFLHISDAGFLNCTSVGQFLLGSKPEFTWKGDIIIAE